MEERWNFCCIRPEYTALRPRINYSTWQVFEGEAFERRNERIKLIMSHERISKDRKVLCHRLVLQWSHCVDEKALFTVLVKTLSSPCWWKRCRHCVGENAVVNVLVKTLSSLLMKTLSSLCWWKRCRQCVDENALVTVLMKTLSSMCWWKRCRQCVDENALVTVLMKTLSSLCWWKRSRHCVGERCHI